MSTEEQAAPGSVPNAYGNALSWKWTRQMSAYLRRSGLPLLLCQLRNLAAASGEIAFASDRKPIRIQDIAKAACCDEKDARRYMDAAIRAGVVRVLGERKRGKPTRYALVVSPWPDWQAAEDYLRSTARKRAPGWDQSSGDSDPNQNGGQRPELTAGTPEEVPGTAPRMSSGDSAPNGSGDSAPNNPGGYPWGSQGGADVGFQPQVVGAPEDQSDHHETHHDDPTTWTRCAVCGRPILPDPHRPGRTVHARCEPHLATTDHERHSA
ncbi:hypothetical protein JK361_22685 [Streptomyces sp. 5-8]|uniref:Helix-turn-helix domain-containing protein n=1 Tax=Streptomyces musisoli TaxID=2802280 RepID=A0ABS1P5L6_9ACTN|nr:hypothetical protein [Streptomyces musisoli]MBL1107377.1 hypothetical protein [Streptomyces musisoli]